MFKSVISAALLIIFVCTCRLVPHLSNFSPIIFLSLFMTRFFSKGISYLLIIASMLISDVLLSIHSHYAAFGSWTWFTYSALCVIGYMGSGMDRLEERFSLSALLVLGSSLGFWIWTNFGVWLFSGFYAKDVSGFMQCYVAAIPFLQHSLMSAYLWLVLFFGYQRIKTLNKFVFQIQ